MGMYLPSNYGSVYFPRWYIVQVVLFTWGGSSLVGEHISLVLWFGLGLAGREFTRDHGLGNMIPISIDIEYLFFVCLVFCFALLSKPPATLTI